MTVEKLFAQSRYEPMCKRKPSIVDEAGSLVTEAKIRDGFLGAHGVLISNHASGICTDPHSDMQ